MLTPTGVAFGVLGDPSSLKSQGLPLLAFLFTIRDPAECLAGAGTGLGVSPGTSQPRPNLPNQHAGLHTACLEHHALTPPYIQMYSLYRLYISIYTHTHAYL